MCVLSIKVPIRKNSGNLFNDPRTSQNIVMKTTKIKGFFFVLSLLHIIATNAPNLNPLTERT